jgi:hypothetical protein
LAFNASIATPHVSWLIFMRYCARNPVRVYQSEAIAHSLHERAIACKVVTHLIADCSRQLACRC